MEIVKRAMAMSKEFGIERNGLHLMMDVSACHVNGNPIDLAALRDAQDTDFAHDVFGIERHIDRATGRLTDGFSPRFSK